jgi:hypothetical protein
MIEFICLDSVAFGWALVWLGYQVNIIQSLQEAHCFLFLLSLLYFVPTRHRQSPSTTL